MCNTEAGSYACSQMDWYKCSQTFPFGNLAIRMLCRNTILGPMALRRDLAISLPFRGFSMIESEEKRKYQQHGKRAVMAKPI